MRMFKVRKERGEKKLKPYLQRLHPSALQSYLLGLILMQPDVKFIETLVFSENVYLQRFQKNDMVYNLLCPTKDFPDQVNNELPEFTEAIKLVYDKLPVTEVSLGVICQVHEARNHFVSFCDRFYLEPKSSKLFYPIDEFNKNCEEVLYGPFKVATVGQQNIINDIECGWHAISNLLQVLNLSYFNFSLKNVERVCESGKLSNEQINSVPFIIGQAMLPQSAKFMDYRDSKQQGNHTQYALKTDFNEYCREIIADALVDILNKDYLVTLQLSGQWYQVEDSSSNSIEDEWYEPDDSGRGAMKNSDGVVSNLAHSVEAPDTRVNREAVIQAINEDNLHERFPVVKNLSENEREDVNQLINFFRLHSRAQAQHSL